MTPELVKHGVRNSRFTIRRARAMHRIATLGQLSVEMLGRGWRQRVGDPRGESLLLVSECWLPGLEGPALRHRSRRRMVAQSKKAKVPKCRSALTCRELWFQWTRVAAATCHRNGKSTRLLLHKNQILRNVRTDRDGLCHRAWIG